MKYFQITVIGFWAIVLFSVGCKKNIAEEISQSNTIVQNNSKTKISSDDVSNWLQSKMNPSASLKNSYINKVLQNLQYDKMYVEQFHAKENLIIIPLKNEYFSQHIKPQKNKPIQYLLLVENAEGKIRKSDLILFFPEDAALKKLPANSFHNFFNNEELSVNGTFTLVSLGDVKQYEMFFKNGKKDKFKLWRSGNNSASNNNSNANTASQTCTDWYLVTTYYVNGDVVGTTSEYLGTTCTGGCPPDTECIEPEGGGGGVGGGEVPVAVSREVTYTIKRELTSYEDWEIKGSFNLAGQSFTNSSNNYFTSIGYHWDVCHYYSFTASSNSPTSSRYSLYSKINHTSGLLMNATTASGRISTQMHYPNWPASSGGPKTEYYGDPKSWQASVALY